MAADHTMRAVSAAPARGRNVGEASAAAATHVILIEGRALARDCIERAIDEQGHYRVDSYSSIEDWLTAKDLVPTNAVILFSLVGGPYNYEIIGKLISDANESNNRIVVMSDDEDPSSIAKSLQLGAHGYIPTSLSLTEALCALRFVADGGTYAPANILVDAFQNFAQADSESPQHSDIFTPRQAAVVKALCSGKPNKIIAYELNMCESTVKVHVRNVMRKLKAKNRTEVAVLVQKLNEPAALGGFQHRELART